MQSPHARTLLTARRLIGVTLTAAALVAFAGCKNRTDAAGGDGHDHGKADPHGHEGHDHGGGAGGEGHADEVKLTPEAIERYGLKSEEAQRWVLKPTVIAPARTAFNAEAMAHVGSTLRGRAVEIKVRSGDSVKAGQPLVVIESPELGEAQADWLQKRTAVETAKPAVELARVSWERGRSLHEQSQGLSLTEVQKREAEYKTAVAAVKSAEGAAAAAEHRLTLLGMTKEEVASLASTGTLTPRHTVAAPIDGVVVEREVTQGELVGPDRESLLTLADTRTVWMLADVAEAKLAGISPGAKAWVTIGTPGSETARTIEAVVSFLGLQVDPTTRTAQVRIELPAAESGLKPGMFAQVEIVATEPGNADPAPVVAVPGAAIQTVEGGPAVFVPVANEPNTFAKRAVTIGKPIGGMIPVYSGLVEGERYITAGSFILKAELGKAGAAHEH